MFELLVEEKIDEPHATSAYIDDPHRAGQMKAMNECKGSGRNGLPPTGVNEPVLPASPEVSFPPGNWPPI